MLVFFFFIIVFIISISGLLFSIFFYRRSTNRLWLSYILFFSIISAKMLLNSMILYIRLNVPEGVIPSHIFFNSGIGLSYLVCLLFPFLFTPPFENSVRKKMNLLSFALISTILLAVITLSCFSGINFRNLSPIFLGNPGFLILILIAVYCGFIQINFIRKTKIPLQREMSFLSLIFLVFVLLETAFFARFVYGGRLDSPHYFAAGGLYLLWIALFLIHAARHMKNFSDPALSAGLNEALAKRYALTAQERQIIQMILEGKTNKKIGEKLFISEKTVKNHIYNIFQKTGVRSRMQLSRLIRLAG